MWGGSMRNHDLCRVLALICVWNCVVWKETGVRGQESVVETFEDGNIEDGLPLGWRPASPPWGMGTHVVSNGDLVLTPSNTATQERNGFPIFTSTGVCWDGRKRNWRASTWRPENTILPKRIAEKP
jgi:hypothetical protein